MNNPNLIKPKYTVIVLIYHRTKELVDMALDCIASVKNNSEDYELTIVDNGSTERYAWDTLCDTYIRYEKNWGISHGWNTGIKLARGKYIAIIGDDVLVKRNWLPELQKAMDMPMAGIANVHVEHLPHGKGIIENYKWFSHACFMLTQKTIQRVGYYDEATYFPCNWEDWDYLTRLMKSGLKCYVNYGLSVQHGEGKTVHSDDLSAQFPEMKRRYIQKWGFDPTAYFTGDKPFPFT